jgi:hypothetical protein
MHDPRSGSSQVTTVPRTARMRASWKRVFGITLRPNVVRFFASW